MDYDDAYMNAAYIPNAEEYPDRWAQQAQEFRELETVCGRALLNQAYSADGAYDLFVPSARPAGTLVFVHGGYWKAFDRKYWSHFAAAIMQQDWAVAMVGYPLAPDALTPDITQAVRDAVVAIADETMGPITLAGHSAGGHLVARMAMDDVNLPADVLKRLVHIAAISPVGDLRDLMHTQMNATLQITADIAQRESPTLGPKRPGIPVTVWVGSDERPKFLEQAQNLAQAWDVPLFTQKGRHHFDILDELLNPTGALVSQLTGGQS